MTCPAVSNFPCVSSHRAGLVVRQRLSNTTGTLRDVSGAGVNTARREGPGICRSHWSRREERGKLADLSSPCGGKAWTVERRQEERAPAYQICQNDLLQNVCGPRGIRVIPRWRPEANSPSSFELPRLKVHSC